MTSAHARPPARSGCIRACPPASPRAGGGRASEGPRKLRTASSTRQAPVTSPHAVPPDEIPRMPAHPPARDDIRACPPASPRAGGGRASEGPRKLRTASSTRQSPVTSPHAVPPDEIPRMPTLPPARDDIRACPPASPRAGGGRASEGPRKLRTASSTRQSPVTSPHAVPPDEIPRMPTLPPARDDIRACPPASPRAGGGRASEGPRKLRTASSTRQSPVTSPHAVPPDEIPRMPTHPPARDDIRACPPASPRAGGGRASEGPRKLRTTSSTRQSPVTSPHAVPPDEIPRMPAHPPARDDIRACPPASPRAGGWPGKRGASQATYSVQHKTSPRNLASRSTTRRDPSHAHPPTRSG